MARSNFLKVLVITFTSISSVSAATFTADFGALAGSYSNTLVVNDFFTISRDGGLNVGSAGIFGFGGPPVIFAFDTSKVNVSSILVGGNSNNAPVQINAFGSLSNDTIFTSNGWTEISQIVGIGSISQLDITLLESSITSFQFEYEAVTTVPVPAAVWLFGSGLIVLSSLVRRKGNVRV